MATPERVFVVGVGLTRFVKPKDLKVDYPDLVEEAVRACLADAAVDYDAVESVIAGYVRAMVAPRYVCRGGWPGGCVPRLRWT
jgi:acetyl-CoA acetyltransferase